MKVGIYYHDKKVPAHVVRDVVSMLEARGATAVSSCEEIEKADRIIVLGGDGSMLRAAKKASALDIPIVGVNYGTLGFLTEFERGEEAEAVELALDPNCALLKRSMLEAESADKKVLLLNELAFMRRIAPDSEDAVVRISVNIDGSPAGEFSADGLIVCTPTGSTAYSLSAGGAILTPDCGAFLLTPVNAFSMRGRPIACSDGSTLLFTFPGPGKIVMHGDGVFFGEVAAGDRVTVRKADRYATFLTKRNHDFFRRLTEKIN